MSVETMSGLLEDWFLVDRNPSSSPQTKEETVEEVAQKAFEISSIPIVFETDPPIPSTSSTASNPNPEKIAEVERGLKWNEKILDQVDKKKEEIRGYLSWEQSKGDKKSLKLVSSYKEALKRLTKKEEEVQEDSARLAKELAELRPKLPENKA